MAARRRRKAAKRKRKRAPTRRTGITCKLEGRGATRFRVCRDSKGRFVKKRGR